MWRDFPTRFCDELGVRGLVYSRFGYGRSTPRPHGERFPPDYLHREAMEVLPKFLDILGVDAAFPVRPQRWRQHRPAGGRRHHLAVSRASLSSAPHYFVEEISIENIRAARTAYEEHGLRERLALYHDDVDSAFYGWNDVWLDPAFRDWNIEAELEKIVCPVLAIQGEDDEYASLEQIYGIRRRIAHAELLVLPDCRSFAASGPAGGGNQTGPQPFWNAPVWPSPGGKPFHRPAPS